MFKNEITHKCQQIINELKITKEINEEKYTWSGKSLNIFKYSNCNIEKERLCYRFQNLQGDSRVKYIRDS